MAPADAAGGALHHLLSPQRRCATAAIACCLAATLVVSSLIWYDGSRSAARVPATRVTGGAVGPTAEAALAAAALASASRPHVPLGAMGFEQEAQLRQQVFCEEAFPLLEVQRVASGDGGGGSGKISGSEISVSLNADGSGSRAYGVVAREVVPGATIYVYSGGDAVSYWVAQGLGWENNVLQQVLWAMQHPLPSEALPNSNATVGAPAAPHRSVQATTAAAAAAATAAAIDAAAGTLASAPQHQSVSTTDQQQQPPPPLFVDVGANVGWLSVNVAARGFRVAAFEGMATNVALVRASVCASPALGDRLRLYAFGLGAADAVCYLVSGVNNRGDGFTLCSAGTEADARAKVSPGDVIRGRLPLHRLDAVLPPPPPGAASSHANQIKVLKMDVEGYEPHVLSGLGALRPWYICTEYHPTLLSGVTPGYRPGQLLDDLMARGYRLSAEGFQGPWMTEAQVHGLVAETKQLINVYGAHKDLFAGEPAAAAATAEAAAPAVAAAGEAVAPTMAATGEAVALTMAATGEAVAPTMAATGEAVAPTVAATGEAAVTTGEAVAGAVAGAP